MVPKNQEPVVPQKAIVTVSQHLVTVSILVTADKRCNNAAI
jgi:hypothetical protein